MKQLYRLKGAPMDSLEELDTLKGGPMDSLKELDTLKGGQLKMNELETINYITDTIKNIDKICMLEEDGSYSEGGNWNVSIDGTYGNSRRSGRGYSRNSESYNNAATLIAESTKHAVTTAVRTLRK